MAALQPLHGVIPTTAPGPLPVTHLVFTIGLVILETMKSQKVKLQNASGIATTSHVNLLRRLGQKSQSLGRSQAPPTFCKVSGLPRVSRTTPHQFPDNFPKTSLTVQSRGNPARRKLWFLIFLEPKSRNEGTFAKTGKKRGHINVNFLLWSRSG